MSSAPAAFNPADSGDGGGGSAEPESPEPFIFYTKAELIEKFGVEEYVVFALMLAVSAGIGIFFWLKGWREEKEGKEALERMEAETPDLSSNHRSAHHQKHTATILLGGRNMGTLPMTLSLVASFMSAITLLGTPAEMYTAGTQYIALVLAYPFVMASAAHLYMPVFHDLGVWTSYEYLEWRFDKSVRIICSCCFTLQMVLYMAIVVYTPALALSQITGFQVDLACGIIFIVCIFYTAIGGIKAVMWTDTFQAVMMFGSFLAVIIKGNSDAGGAKKVFDLNYQTNRIELFNFDFDPTTRHTVWGLLIGGYFTWISIYGINQTQVQRYLTVPTKKQAAKAIWWNILGIGSLLLMCAYAGLVIFAYYYNVKCDPIKIELVSTKDQLFPLFVMQVMGDIPCIPGLFVAGVFSGALSTVSSGLNSLAAVTLQDFIVASGKVDLDPAKKPRYTKMLAVGYGILSYLVVFLVKYLPGVLEAALGIFGIVGGPVLGAFTLGMFFPWANAKGAFAGTFVSLVMTMWIGFGQTVAKNYGAFKGSSLATTIEGCPEEWVANLTAKAAAEAAKVAEEIAKNGPPEPPSFTHLPVYEVSYMWFSAIAFTICMIVGLIVSFLTKPQDPKTLDPKLISPGFRSLFSIWPAPIADYFRDFDIGSRHVVSEREERLRHHQYKSTPATTNNGNANNGFMMDEMSKK